MSVAGCFSFVVSRWIRESAGTRNLIVSFYRVRITPPTARKKPIQAESLSQGVFKLMKNVEVRRPSDRARLVLRGDGRCLRVVIPRCQLSGQKSRGCYAQGDDGRARRDPVESLRSHKVFLPSRLPHSVSFKLTSRAAPLIWLTSRSSPSQKAGAGEL